MAVTPEESAEPTEQQRLEPQAQNCILANAALLVFVATLVVSALPFYRLVRQGLDLAQTRPDAGAMATIFLGIVFGAALPTFFWVLYRGAATLRFRDDLRLTALLIAILSAILVLTSTGLWISRVFTNYDSSVLAASPSPFNLNNLLALAMSLVNLAPVAVLYALSRQPATERIEPPYRPLRIVSTITVVIAIIVLAFLAIRIAAFPHYYQTIRAQAIRNGYGAPTLIGLMADGLRTFIEQACAYAAPILVWLSLRSKPAAPARLAAPLEEQPSHAHTSDDTEHPAGPAL